MSETTAESYKLECSMCGAGNCTDGLHLAYRELEKERDRLSVLLREEGERGGAALMERAQAEARRDEAVRRLRARSERIHHLQKHQYGLGSRANWEKCGTEPCIDDRTFLASLEKHD